MATIIKTTATHYTLGSESRPTVISKAVYNGVKHNTLYPMQSPDASYNHPAFDGRIELSTSNSKVIELGHRLSKSQACYGKTTVQSCVFAGSCIRFCYQNVIKYPASLRLHAHNYAMIYGKSRQAAFKVINAGFIAANYPDIIRLQDNGDFISKAEILAWVDMAALYPDTIFYGYTKNTPHLYLARKEFGQFPSNFRVSISDLDDNDNTSEKYQEIIRTEYPNEFRVCHIIDTPERDKLYQDIPFNDGEIQAYNYTSDFKIALHVGTSQRKDCTAQELEINDKYSSGHDDNGIGYC